MKKLFIGPKSQNIPERYPQCFKVEIIYFLRIWNDRKETTFGITRLFLLVLSILRFFCLSIIFTNTILHKSKKGTSNLFIDFYIIFKVIYPIIILFLNLSNPYTIGIGIYFISESFIILLSVIFFNKIARNPLSEKRSLLILFLNYIQFQLSFALLYKYYHVIKNLICNWQSIYFSFVTSSTLGYGDYYPINILGYILVTLHIIISLFFIVLFFTFFMSEIKYIKK